MNPLSNLIGNKFKDLTVNELIQVMHNYCDENNYPYNYDKEFKTVKEVIFYFENNYHNIEILKNHFKFWTE